MGHKGFKKFWKDESGATVIEYALISALISIAAVTALNFLGTTLSDPFNAVALNIATAMSGT